MAEDVNIKLSNVDPSTLDAGKVCYEKTVDSDLGFKPLSGKHHDGNTLKMLAKDQKAQVTNLKCTDITDGTTTETTTAIRTDIDQNTSDITDLKSAPPSHAVSHTDGTDDIQDATATQKGLATATQITKLDGIETGAQANNISDTNATALTGGGDTSLHTHPVSGLAAHATTHTDGTDDIQAATATQKGLATATQITKLDGIETGAQVNTVTSVFTRTGDVVAAASDYDASQVDNDSSVVGTYVSDALDTLQDGNADILVNVDVDDIATTVDKYGLDQVNNGYFMDWTDPTFPDGWVKYSTHDANNYWLENTLGAQVVSDGSSTPGIRQTINLLDLNRSYEVVYDISSISGTLVVQPFGSAYSTNITTPGLHVINVTTPTDNILYQRSIGVSNVVIRSVKAREKRTVGNTDQIPVHTVASNLLKDSDLADTGVWGRFNLTSTASGILSPVKDIVTGNASEYYNLIVSTDGVPTIHQLRQANIVVSANEQNTVRFMFKKTISKYIKVIINAIGNDATFNVDTGEVAVTGIVSEGSVVKKGDNDYLCSFTFVPTANVTVRFYVADDAGNHSFIGAGENFGYISAPWLYYGTIADNIPFVRTTTAAIINFVSIKWYDNKQELWANGFVQRLDGGWELPVTGREYWSPINGGYKRQYFPKTTATGTTLLSSSGQLLGYNMSVDDGTDEYPITSRYDNGTDSANIKRTTSTGAVTVNYSVAFTLTSDFWIEYK
jgi:hypothetical protein